MAASVQRPDNRSESPEIFRQIRMIVPTFRLSYLTTLQQQRSFVTLMQRIKDRVVAPMNPQHAHESLIDEFVSTYCASTERLFVNFTTFEGVDGTTMSAPSLDFRKEVEHYIGNTGVVNSSDVEDSHVKELLRASYTCDYLYHLATMTRSLFPQAKLYDRTYLTIHQWCIHAVENYFFFSDQLALLDNETRQSSLHTDARAFFVTSLTRMFQKIQDLTVGFTPTATISVPILRTHIPSINVSEIAEVRQTIQLHGESTQFFRDISSERLKEMKQTLVGFLEVLSTRMYDSPVSGDVLRETHAQLGTIAMCSYKLKFWLFVKFLERVHIESYDEKFVLRFLYTKVLDVSSVWIYCFVSSLCSQRGRVTFQQFLTIRRCTPKVNAVSFATIAAVCNGEIANHENLTASSRTVSNIAESVRRLREEFFASATAQNAPTRVFTRYWQGFAFLAATIRHATKVLSCGRTLDITCRLWIDVANDLLLRPYVQTLLFEDSNESLVFSQLLDLCLASIADAISANPQSMFVAAEVDMLLHMLSKRRSLSVLSEPLQDDLALTVIGACDRMLFGVDRAVLIPSVKSSNVLDYLLFQFPNLTDTYKSILRRWRPTALNFLHYYLFRLDNPEVPIRFSVEKFPEENGFYAWRLACRRSDDQFPEDLSAWLEDARLVVYCTECMSEDDRQRAQCRSAMCSRNVAAQQRREPFDAQFDRSRRLNPRVVRILDESRHLPDTFLESVLRTMISSMSTSNVAVQMMDTLIVRKKSLSDTLANECSRILQLMSVRIRILDAELFRKVLTAVLSKSTDSASMFDTDLLRVPTDSEELLELDGTPKCFRTRNPFARRIVRTIQSAQMPDILSRALQDWSTRYMQQDSKRKTAKRNGGDGDSATSRTSPVPLPYSVLSEMLSSTSPVEFTEEAKTSIDSMMSSRPQLVESLLVHALVCLDVTFVRALTERYTKSILARCVSFGSLDRILETYVYFMWRPKQSLPGEPNADSSLTATAASASTAFVPDWSVASQSIEQVVDVSSRIVDTTRVWLESSDMLRPERKVRARDEPVSSATMSITPKRIRGATLRPLFGVTKITSKAAGSKAGASCSANEMEDVLEQTSTLTSTSVVSSGRMWSKLFFYSLFVGNREFTELLYRHLCEETDPLVDRTCEIEVEKFLTITTQCLQSALDSKSVNPSASQIAEFLRPTALWLLDTPAVEVLDRSAIWTLLEQLLLVRVVPTEILTDMIRRAAARCRSNVPSRLVLEVDDAELFRDLIFEACPLKHAESFSNLYARAKKSVRAFLERNVLYPSELYSGTNPHQLQLAFWKVGCRIDAMMDPISMTRFAECDDFDADSIFSIDGGRNWLLASTIIDLIRTSSRERVYNGVAFEWRRRVVDPFSRTRVEHSVLEHVVQHAREKAIVAGRQFNNPLEIRDESSNFLSGVYTIVQSTVRINNRVYLQISLRLQPGLAVGPRSVLNLNVIPVWIEDTPGYRLNPNEMPSAVLIRLLELLQNGRYFTEEAQAYMAAQQRLHIPDVDGEHYTTDTFSLLPALPTSTFYRIPRTMLQESIRALDSADAIYNSYIEFVAALDRIE